MTSTLSKKIYNILKKKTKETHEINKQIVAAEKNYFKERHVQATSQIPKLAEKVRQADGFWNKVKVVFIGIFQNIKDSMATVKRQNKELRELRRSRKNILKNNKNNL